MTIKLHYTHVLKMNADRHDAASQNRSELSVGTYTHTHKLFAPHYTAQRIGFPRLQVANPDLGP